MRKAAILTAPVLAILVLNHAAVAAVPEATQATLSQYPGLRVHMNGNRVMALYGMPMSPAATPGLAVEQWLRNHAAALGVPHLDLRLSRSNTVGQDARFTVFAYDQFIHQLPVEWGFAKLLVLNGTPNSVVYVGAKLAAIPAAGFQPDAVTANAAVAGVQAMPAYAHLPVWRAPQMVIFYSEAGDEAGQAVRAWKFVGVEPDLNNYDAYTFFVDASNGALVHVRKEVYNVDVDGHVSGMATPGTFPDSPGNPPAITDMPDLRVAIQGGNESFTDRDGFFTIANGGAGQVTIEADMRGLWVSVHDAATALMHLEQDVTPPGPANFLFNEAPTGFHTAEVNAALHTTNTHNFYKDRQPDFNGLDIDIDCNVNLNQNCNAFYSPDEISINFFTPGGACPNSAYTSVIAHEYGHFVVAVHNLGQGAFGEGFGDTLSILEYDDPIIARDFFGIGNPIRNIVTANQQYPCTAAIHTCGQVLAGVWWDTKLAMQETLGEEEGLALVRQLMTDWMEITNGGQGPDSAHPQTAIEALIADDDDGFIDNGTPHRDDICEGFAAHSIQCPELPDLAFSYPDGRPQFTHPITGATVLVEIHSVEGTLNLDEAPLLHVSIDGGKFDEIEFAQVEGESTLFTASLPPAGCFSEVDWFVSAETIDGKTVTNPSDAPTSTYQSLVATGTILVFEEDFENPVGYSVSGDAFDGQWDFGIPVNCARGDPPTDFDGSGNAYLTDNSAAGQCNSDVDDGSTILTTPALDMGAHEAYLLSYARWYSNDFGNAPNSDIFVIEISNDDGNSWTALETVGPTGPEVGGGWFVKTFYVNGIIEPTSEMRVRFNASDLGEGSVIEAAIDALKIERLVCDAEDLIPPEIVHDSGLTTDPFTGYIDPRNESSDGETLDKGVSELTILFTEQVQDIGALTGGTVSAAAFAVFTTGGIVPEVMEVDDSQNPLIRLTLSGPIPVGEWTTIVASVEDLSGNEIVDVGNQGPGVNESDRIDIGFEPGDIDQSGGVEVLDLLRFRQIVTGVFQNPEGDDLDYVDTDRNGALEPVDLLFYRQLLLGTGNATREWLGETIVNRP